MPIIFNAATSPFSRWQGPYSVARGTKSGFRFHRGKLGSYVTTQNRQEFWTVEPSPGAVALAQLVKLNWGCGRVLLAPDGRVIKPDPNQAADCVRYPIGRIQGDLVVMRPNGTRFNLLNTQHQPGDEWPGPPTTGIECVLDTTGRLECEWQLDAPFGRLVRKIQILGPGAALGNGLRAARPGVGSARVRVQYGGAIITRIEDNAELRAFYVGRIDGTNWPFDPNWVI